MVSDKCKVIFEDQNLLVIDKPPGLVVTPSETQTKETLSDILIKDFGINLERGGVVHRLDKDTSGLILAAKTASTLENLQSQFKERKIKKEYIALVHGLMEASGRIDKAIGRNPGDREKFTVLDKGKEAVTEYELLKKLQMPDDKLQIIFDDFNKIQIRKLLTARYSLFTLISCRPLTGRTHQIRVHLKYIGHPIAADEKYSGRKMVRLDKRWVRRQFLHASRLGFSHPLSGQWVEFESKLPEDLEEALGLLDIK